MPDTDTTLLEHERVEVEDLYRDLVVQRTLQATEVLRSYPSEAVAAQGAECLTDTVAHLYHAAERLAEGRPWAQARFASLALQLLPVAAELERSADRYRAGLD